MYFIFGYVETALTECTTLSSLTPTGMKGLAAPSAASTGAAVAGTIFWNAYDEANGNKFTHNAKSQLIVSNGGTGSVTLVLKTVNDTLNGFARTVADLSVVLAPGEIYFSGVLPAPFNDGGKVKLTLTDVNPGDSLADCFLAVERAI